MQQNFFYNKFLSCKEIKYNKLLTVLFPNNFFSSTFAITEYCGSSAACNSDKILFSEPSRNKYDINYSYVK